jgi:hypothetical protein
MEFEIGKIVLFGQFTRFLEVEDCSVPLPHSSTERPEVSNRPNLSLCVLHFARKQPAIDLRHRSFGKLAQLAQRHSL